MLSVHTAADQVMCLVSVTDRHLLFMRGLCGWLSDCCQANQNSHAGLYPKYSLLRACELERIRIT